MGKRKDREEIRSMIEHRKSAQSTRPEHWSASSHIPESHRMRADAAARAQGLRYTADTIAPTETAAQYAARVNGSEQ